MIENFKTLYHTVLSPFAYVLKKMNVHPNVLTVSGVLFFAVGGWLIILDHWIWSLVVGSLGAFLDGLDGIIARETNKQSQFGGILDSTCDRFTEIIWILSLVIYYQQHNLYTNVVFYLAFLAITGSIMVSYVRARAESSGITCKKGILQRPERLLILALCQGAGPYYMVYGLGIVAAISYLTVLQRLIIAWRNCQNHQ